MKILNYWLVAVMALAFSTTFVACSDDDDDATNLAKEIAGSYQYNTCLFLSVTGMGEQGSTDQGSVIIENSSETTVNITIDGFSKTGSAMSSFDKFTVNEVKVTKESDGSYSLHLDEFTVDAEKTAGGILEINGKSLNGTITADGTINITAVFAPGAMPLDITTVFTGSKNRS